MGCCRCSSPTGESAASLGLTGEEVFSITGLARRDEPTVARRRATVAVTAEREGGEPVEFDARVRIDTPREAEYFRHGGILQYVLRRACWPDERRRDRNTATRELTPAKSDEGVQGPRDAARPAHRARSVGL